MSKKIYDIEKQFLTIAPAKDIGLDKQGFLVYVDPVGMRFEEAGLSRLLVYSVASPAYALFARQLVDARDPIPISQFLASAWSPAQELGMPLKLEVRQELMNADQGYAAWVREQGVELALPSLLSSQRSLAARERMSLDIQFAALFSVLGDETVRRSISDANKSIRQYEHFHSRISSRTSAEQMSLDAWRWGGKRFATGNGVGRMDWLVPAVTARYA